MQINKISTNYSSQTFGMPFINKANPFMLREIKKLSPQKQTASLYMIDYLDKNSPHHNINYYRDLFPQLHAEKNKYIKDANIKDFEINEGIIFNRNIYKMLRNLLAKIEKENKRIASF